MLQGIVVSVLVWLGWTALCHAWISVEKRSYRYRRAFERRTAAPNTALCTTQPSVQGVVASGIEEEECGVLFHVISSECQDHTSRALTTFDDLVHLPAETVSSVVPGAMGRVLVLKTTDISEETMEELQFAISQEIDQVLYDETSPIRQPILLSIQQAADTDLTNPDILRALIQTHVDEYALVESFRHSGADQPSATLVPIQHIQVDGAMVVDPFTARTFWDTSSVLVFDNLISDNLRQMLLDVVLGQPTEDNEPWDDVTNGPDPHRWVRGGLADIPDGEAASNETGGFGLSHEAIEELCFEEHGAVQEFESILANLFPDLRVARLPEAVLGASVSPLTANAPIHGHDFQYHIDADPNLAPPSPWTDVYGIYPNRAPGKPRFMSCLVYLNDEWNYEEWGAPTRILDVSTETVYDVEPKPGRVVFMDQDITHSVVAPKKAAGKRPRYSLVWKLILHPSAPNQDMQQLLGPHTDLPEPIFIGGSNR